MAEDAGRGGPPPRWGIPGEELGGESGDGIICPTCERTFPVQRRPDTGTLVEPIPERPPLMWLKVASAALGAALLLGGTALSAYRVGVSSGEGSGGGKASGLASLQATSPGSSMATLPSGPSTDTTSPLFGSLDSSAATGSLEDSMNASLDSLRQRLGSGLLGSDGGLYGSPGGGTGGPPSGQSDLSARAKLSASSVLAPARGFTYVPANLVDGKRDTCWAEGAPGYGIGQSVTFDFGREVTVDRIEVLPGYDKVLECDRWKSNGRLKEATLRFDDGTTQRAAFEDAKRSQSIAVPSRRTRRLTVTIAAAYPAVPGLHAAEDTSIGEMHVYGR